MSKPYKNEADVFKAFADASRLLILDKLRSGEMHADALLKKLPIAQSTLSHHMKLLVDTGIVLSRKDGRMVYYQISETNCNAAADFLIQVTDTNAQARRRKK
jgi:ArsR family transcriptional regulator